MTRLLIITLMLPILSLTLLGCKANKFIESENEKILKSRIEFLELEIISLEKENRKILSHPEGSKCYASCYFQPQYETITEFYNIYTGEKSTLNGIQVKVLQSTEEIITINKELKPIYDQDGSNDISDCIYFCLDIEKKIQLDTILIVIDTMNNKQFERQAFKKRNRIKSGEFTQWREMIIPNNSNRQRKFVSEVQIALKELGYEIDVTNNLDMKTKQSIKNYQKQNNLPIGQIDPELLKSLGIEY